ncbi:histone deacetylase complex subunit SAP30 homolog isoform X2 [Cimex lectularius]|uniref:Histone deacetylase complex subunit SAP30 homolog n=1 Tax=Cimex lectularius TaxID=79782 RepID=A0A8I6RNN2_CIMLE|nr:histone deacetylase complex subunit SAP30 homolog isoform X2 [Cimex lectularius]
MSGSHSCLSQCHRKAGNASYSKRIQKIVTQRKLKLHLDQGARHIYICDYHKSVIQSARSKRGNNKYSDDDSDVEQMEIDLSQLSVNTLRRYKKHFNVNTKHGLNKAQLADKLTQHFRTIQITDKTEKSITNRFMYLMRINGNKLDRKNGSDTT